MSGKLRLTHLKFKRANNNLFAYANSNPLVYVDPTGEWGFLLPVIGALAIVVLYNDCIERCMDADRDGECDKYDPTDPDSRKRFGQCANYCFALATLWTWAAGYTDLTGTAVTAVHPDNPSNQ